MMKVFGVLFVALVCGCAFAYSADVGIPSIRVPDPADYVKKQMPIKKVSYDDNLNWRVVGGSDAKQGQFPYIVSLRLLPGSNHFCGGSIISSSYVLSAAHCTGQHSPSEIAIMANSTTLNGPADRYLVSRIITHAGYNPATGANDISLLKTSTNINFGEFVSSIEIAAAEVGGGEPVVLSGWGTTIPGGAIPNKLQFIDLRTISHDECVTRHADTPRPIVTSEICTLTKQGEGACHGDSGGPLAVQNTLVGIVSWGRPCAVGYPDVYTRVSAFVDWILENAK